MQSVIIGWYSRKRILALGDFSLANTSGFDRGSPEATQRGTARFFVMHYGLCITWTPWTSCSWPRLRSRSSSRIAPPTGASWPPTSLAAGHGGGVLLFGTPKTVADVLMHWIEHRITGATVESAA